MILWHTGRTKSKEVIGKYDLNGLNVRINYIIKKSLNKFG